MLNTAGNQAIELSAHNSYKYVKMDHYSDSDETSLYKIDRYSNPELNLESSLNKRLKAKKTVIISLSLVILAFILFATIGAILISDKPTNYSGHKVYKLLPASVDDLNVIIKLEKDFQVVFWNEPYLKDPSEPILIQISPGEENKITRELIKWKLNFTILIEDLQQAIEEERIAHQKTDNETQFNFGRYHTYEEILDYLEKEVKNSSLAQIDSIGKSFEGRKIPVIRITNNKNVIKPVILIESLIHAKEWISGATNLYIINELISKELMKRYLNKFEFHIIPILNPDGYAYSWRSDRLWRKTRSLSIGSIFCRGADGNRNFDVNFCNDTEEDINNPCSENYCGDYPFSELEMIALRDYAIKLNKTNQIKAYFSLHCYKQKFLYPFAYKSDPPNNMIELQNLTNIAVKAIKSISGSIYTAGSASDIMYSASGTSIDWIYDKLNVQLSFTIELRDRGEFGHLLPKELILPTAHEAWHGINAILDVIS